MRHKDERKMVSIVGFLLADYTGRAEPHERKDLLDMQQFLKDLFDKKSIDHDDQEPLSMTRLILEDLTDRACKNEVIKHEMPKNLCEFTDWLRGLYPELYSEKAQ